MAKVKPRNMVRFAWWGAEEAGLIGSRAYVNGLSQAERDRIALYLNFNMVGSLNHVLFIYDGDDSDTLGVGPGPGGSDRNCMQARSSVVLDEMVRSGASPLKGSFPALQAKQRRSKEINLDKLGGVTSW